MRYTGLFISLLSFVYSWGESAALRGFFYSRVTLRDVFLIYCKNILMICLFTVALVCLEAAGPALPHVRRYDVVQLRPQALKERARRSASSLSVRSFSD